MGFDLWVVPFDVSRFPSDRRQSYRVIQCQHQPHWPGACQHTVEATTLHEARVDAVVLHRQQVACGGMRHGD